MQEQITICDISTRPSSIDDVMALWRTHSKTLGMFTAGAFEEHAQRDRILVAQCDTGSTDKVIGYLLYRITRKNVAITHLCVGNAYRGHGVARKLVNALAKKTSHHPGIVARCRRDYDTNRMWPKLGFERYGEKKGRGHDAATIDIWWYAHSHQNLFTAAIEVAKETTATVVMDSNVLFDMIREHHGDRFVASKALTEDWLADTLTLYVTDEIFNEIQRQDDDEVRDVSTKKAGEFPVLNSTGDDFNDWFTRLRPIFPGTLSIQDESDLRQLARSAAGEADYFATWDLPLNEIAVEVEEIAGIKILNPTELISRLDEIERTSLYEPARFLGSNVTIRLMQASDIDKIVDYMRHSQESKRALRSKLQRLVASPKSCELRVIESEGISHAIIATEESNESARLIDIPLLRTSRDRSSSTYARQLVRQAVKQAAADQFDVIQASDPHLSHEAISALSDHGFIELLNGWTKINIHGICTGAEAAGTLLSIANAANAEEHEGFEEWAKLLSDIDTMNPAQCTEQETYLWPMKIRGAVIPNYIVPIQPAWAAELFDDRLQQSSLLNRRTDLATNTEAAYYKSARGLKLQAPARILWYVSTDKRPGESMRIRACSQLEEVVIGPAKAVYRRFKRLGVYEWRHVIKTAKNDPDGDVMALRFTRTELLPNCIQFNRIQELLQDRNNQLISPIAITPDEFEAIYTECSQSQFIR